MSIPPEDVQKKLEVIAVFALVDEKGGFYQVTREDTLFIPLYLDLLTAKKQLDKLSEGDKDLKVKVKAFSLNKFYEQAEGLRANARSQGKALETPVVVEEFDMLKARELLREQGVSDEEVREGLRVPIFFAEPMIAAQTPEGKRELFFVTYEQLRESISVLPKGSREVIRERAADLGSVLNLIRKAKEDRYAFMATEGYLRLREAFLESQK